MGIINDATHTRDIEIGKIDILRKFSFFEVDNRFEKTIIDAFKNVNHEDTKLEVQVSKPEPSAAGARDFSRADNSRRDKSKSRKPRSSRDSRDSRESYGAKSYKRKR
jgi:ATP-dependent RNA helicase DeaD